MMGNHCMRSVLHVTANMGMVGEKHDNFNEKATYKIQTLLFKSYFLRNKLSRWFFKGVQKLTVADSFCQKEWHAQLQAARIRIPLWLCIKKKKKMIFYIIWFIYLIIPPNQRPTSTLHLAFNRKQTTLYYPFHQSNEISLQWANRVWIELSKETSPQPKPISLMAWNRPLTNRPLLNPHEFTNQ